MYGVSMTKGHRTAVGEGAFELRIAIIEPGRATVTERKRSRHTNRQAIGVIVGPKHLQ